MKMFTGVWIAGLLLFTPTVTEALEKRQPPSIIPEKDLPDKYRKPGDVITLPCRATGIPPPSYVWLHDGKELESDSNIKPLEDGNIEFSMVKDREGYYQCKATNEHGSSLSEVIQLQLAEIGTFPGGNQIEQVYKSVGESLELGIQGDLHSVPTPVFTWQVINSVDDEFPRELQLNRRVIKSKEGSLYFTHLLREDHNLVKLSAFNNFIDTTKGGRYTRINVQDGMPTPRSPSPLYPKSQSTDVIAMEGEDLELQCIFSGFPLVSIAWQSPNGISFEKHDENNTLRVNHVTRDHEGRFTCHGENTAGRNQIDINVDVQSRPKFMEGGKPESVIKTEGETVSFRCQTTDDTEPAADITWLFNGEPVDVNNPGPRTTFTEGNKFLTISDLDRDTDLQVIQCNASNHHGYVFTDAVLNVLVRTQVDVTPKVQALNFNETKVTLDCLVESDPLIQTTVSWTHDGYPVDENEDPNFQKGNNGRQLNIYLDQVDWEDKRGYLGPYTCKATNRLSEAEASTRLIKKGHIEPAGLPVTAEDKFPLWIILAGCVGFFILTILLAIHLYRRNKTNAYLVDEAERKQGNDPIGDLVNMGFHEYQRPEDEFIQNRDSRRSSGKLSVILGSEASDSLNEYGEEIINFSENGSFIGEYMGIPSTLTKPSKP